MRYLASGKFCDVGEGLEMRGADGNSVIGQPYLTLPREGITGGLSISHDGEYVVAMAMLPPEQSAMAEWVQGRREEAVAVHG